VEKKIGESAQGGVYKLKRTEIDGTHYYSALKVVFFPPPGKNLFIKGNADIAFQESNAFIDEFIREMTKEISFMYCLKGLSNIVSYEDHLIIPNDDDNSYYVLLRMELLTDLTTMLRNPDLYPINEKDVIRLGIDICTALEICQKHHIIHRDIKPENIFISPEGSFKLGDFGISRKQEKTMLASSKGTVSYMAPEIFHNAEYDRRADIYSLGVVMYLLLKWPVQCSAKYMASAFATDKAVQLELPIGENILPEPSATTIVLSKLGASGRAFQSCSNVSSYGFNSRSCWYKPCLLSI